MADYIISLTKYAQKQLDKLDDFLAEPIFQAIQNLSFNPRPVGYKKLKGIDAYRIKIGDFRVIYTIFDDIILIEIIGIAHRKDIYKKK